jgi:Uma2 family endonuclease
MVRSAGKTEVVEGARMSAEDLAMLPDSPHRYELVNGVLHMMSPAGARHGRIALRLGRRLGEYVERQGLGETYAAETGFLISRNPDTVRAPDVAYVSHSRLGDQRDCPGYLPIVPDLVAEIVSPSEVYREVREKVLAWLRAGTELVLVVDPESRSVEVHHPQGIVETYAEGSIPLVPVLPGLVLEVEDIFG